MTTLHAAITERIDKLETIAQLATLGLWERSSQYGRVDVFRHPYNPGDAMVAEKVDAYDAHHILTWYPTTVLRGLAEDRDILTRHRPLINISGVPVECTCAEEWLCPEIQSLARRHGIEVPREQ